MKNQTQNLKPKTQNNGSNYLIIKYISFTLCILSFTLLLASTAFAAEGSLSDPMSLGVGARPLGMGKAYVAVAEDGDALFMNPAGIARATTPKLATMYTSLMGDVSYLVAGGVYPYGERSAIGAGIVNSRVSDIRLTDSTGAAAGTGSWSNSVIFLSYGTYLPLKLDRDILVGGSLKYFSVGGEGTGVKESSGSGFDVDLGLLCPITDYVMVGVNYQNALPNSMGAKITKTTGSTDGIPATLKVGTKVTLIGKENEAISPHNTRKLYGSLDYDYYPGGNNAKALHYGLEFWPINNLALRVGSDNNDLTAGIGVRFSGVEFNYAYHPYNGINENTTQFFSIGYLGESRKREVHVKVDSPADKAVVYEDHVNVKGKVEVVESDDPDAPKGPISVKINGAAVALAADNTFSADVPLDAYGKKQFQVEVSDTLGNTEIADLRLVRLNQFADVPDGYWAKQPIENNATVGLIQGYPDKTFRPENALTRAELATLLVRAKGIKLPDRKARGAFKDVKPDFWAAKYIEVAEKDGLIEGYPDKTFRPNNKINKVEGIVVMSRFDDLKLTEVNAKPYWDVEADNWAAKYIQAAKDAGMLKFVERNKLRGAEAMARSEMVDMLAKTSVAGGKIKDLYTWEKGFTPQQIKERPQIKASLY